MLYKHAAINYEKDMEFLNFSECFYHSKECRRRFLNYCLLNSKKIKPITKSEEEKGFQAFIKRIFHWVALTSSYLVWGHGERPSRTALTGIIIVFLSTFLYMQGYVSKGAEIFHPHFTDALYFSVITFSTVGYGDIIPVGFTKVFVMIESLCGLFIVSLFIVGLSRKYLRI